MDASKANLIKDNNSRVKNSQLAVQTIKPTEHNTTYDLRTTKKSEMNE